MFNQNEKIPVAILTLSWLESIVIAIILMIAFYMQIALHELPCPLCLLQRLGLLGIAAALLFNVRFGLKPSHYSLILLSAILTMLMAMRQILLHINGPAGSGYGAPFLGLHLYTWVFIFAGIVIVYTSIVLGIDNEYKYKHKALMHHHRLSKLWVHLLCVLLLVVAVLNLSSVMLECGFHQCADNPVHYRLLGE